MAVTAMLLNCTAPELQGGPAMATNITYTVVVDNALGPVNLPLSVLPDPTNFVLGVTEHALGTDTFINIEVSWFLQLHTFSILHSIEPSCIDFVILFRPCVRRETTWTVLK